MVSGGFLPVMRFLDGGCCALRKLGGPVLQKMNEFYEGSHRCKERSLGALFWFHTLFVPFIFRFFGGSLLFFSFVWVLSHTPSAQEQIQLCAVICSWQCPRNHAVKDRGWMSVGPRAGCTWRCMEASFTFLWTADFLPYHHILAFSVVTSSPFDSVHFPVCAGCGTSRTLVEITRGSLQSCIDLVQSFNH